MFFVLFVFYFEDTFRITFYERNQLVSILLVKGAASEAEDLPYSWFHSRPIQTTVASQNYEKIPTPASQNNILCL